MYRDRPMNARETAAYWVEYVIRHRGAPHLRSPAADLNFLQRNSIDVVALLFAIIYVVFKLITKAFKYLAAKMCKSSKNEKKKLKKN
jgi:glucuronosyltransferase